MHCPLVPRYLVLMIFLILTCGTFKLASFSHLPSSPVSLFSSIGRWPCLQIHKKGDTAGHTFSQFFNSLPSLSSSPTLHLVNLQVHWKLDALLLHFLLLCQEWATCFPGSDLFFFYAQCLAHKGNLIHVCGTRLKYIFLVRTLRTISPDPVCSPHVLLPSFCLLDCCFP